MKLVKKKRKAPRAIIPSKTTKKRKVSVDKLPWKTIELPEMFDDAEGFYGLEEVTGVHVVKDGHQVEFVSIVFSSAYLLIKW